MDGDIIQRYYESKKRIVLTDVKGLKYTGTILLVSKDSFIFLDKFNKELSFEFSQIKQIYELGGDDCD